MELSPSALTTLKNAKLYIGIEENDIEQDQILTILINSISAEIAGYCKRELKSSDHTEARKGSGQSVFLLPNYPITAIVSVKVDGRALAVGEYKQIDSAGMLKSDTFWPVCSDIEVAYTAGYVLPNDATISKPQTLPADIEMACMELVAVAYNKRGSEHLSVEVVGPLRSEFIQGMPIHIQSVLNRYRKTVI